MFTVTLAHKTGGQQPPRPCEMEPAEKVRHMGQAAGWPGAAAQARTTVDGAVSRAPVWARAWGHHFAAHPCSSPRSLPARAGAALPRSGSPARVQALALVLPCGFCDRRARHVTKARPGRHTLPCCLRAADCHAAHAHAPSCVLARLACVLARLALPAATDCVFL